MTTAKKAPSTFELLTEFEQLSKLIQNADDKEMATYILEIYVKKWNKELGIDLHKAETTPDDTRKTILPVIIPMWTYPPYVINTKPTWTSIPPTTIVNKPIWTDIPPTTIVATSSSVV